MSEVKKRGRKPKPKSVSVNTNETENNGIINNTDSDVNNISNINTNNNSIQNNIDEKPKKRTRRTKKVENNENIESHNQPVVKKRGRKPKGGKIIECPNVNNETEMVLPNVIVHFKCKLSDLAKYLNDSDSDGDKNVENQYGNFSNFSSNNKSLISSNSIVLPQVDFNNPFSESENKNQNKINKKNSSQKNQTNKSIENEIVPTSIHSGKSNELNYAFVNKETENLNSNIQENNNIEKNIFNQQTNNINENNISNDNSLHNNEKTINLVNNETMMKIHQMEVQFHNNDTNGKRCSCFWDTCPFDTPAFYIPKSMDMNNVRPYGCFCSLNCALAYLQNEDIDISSKFERRQLLFNLYSNVLKDKSFIKPSPDPRYTLDKFYGNLTIQQWRSLLTSDRMLLIVDKPLTPELPELHTETTDRFMSMGSMNTVDPAQYGKFKIRKVAPKQSKTDIVAEKFGVITK